MSGKKVERAVDRRLVRIAVSCIYDAATVEGVTIGRNWTRVPADVAERLVAASDAGAAVQVESEREE